MCTLIVWSGHGMMGSCDPAASSMLIGGADNGNILIWNVDKLSGDYSNVFTQWLILFNHCTVVYNSRDGHRKCLDICVCPTHLITKSCPSVKHVILSLLWHWLMMCLMSHQ